jgi:hypothetical protein
LNTFKDQVLADLNPEIRARLTALGDKIHAEQFAKLSDPVMDQVLREGFARAGADEGTVWLPDEAGEHLVPAFNTGPRTSELVGKFKQPLNQGLVCMVLFSEQPFLENEVWKNSQHSKLLDGLLQTRTEAMLAVPLYFLRACRGVISCVQLKRMHGAETETRGFRPEHLAQVERASALVSRLIEHQLLSEVVGGA